ncbi:YchJ family protein [Nakamurella panacisegetis]
MRARYSAFVRRESTYLLESWHPSTRPGAVDFDPEIRWTGLTVEGRHAGGLLDQVGTVAFVARYRANGRRGEQRENSRFVRENGRWVYLGAV